MVYEDKTNTLAGLAPQSKECQLDSTWMSPAFYDTVSCQQFTLTSGKKYAVQILGFRPTGGIRNIRVMLIAGGACLCVRCVSSHESLM
jgi:hypothetical protein